MKKKRRNGQPEAWMVDQVFQRDPFSKRLLEASKASMVFAIFLYVVLLVIELLGFIGSWNFNAFLEIQFATLLICFGVFSLSVILGFRRCKKGALEPEQMRFEGGLLRFRLGGKDVELTKSSILGVNQHYFRNRHGNILRWLAVYDVRTSEGVYRIDLTCYERDNGAGNWLVHCNGMRNAEKVREWEAAKQAFLASDRVAFGTKLERIVFEQQPPAITLGKRQLDLSAVSRIVVDPTVSGQGSSNMYISFMQSNDKEKAIASLPCRVVADQWDSFLQHLFAIAKRVHIPVELRTEERRDVSQVPSWW
ncbi:hypothetical protein [Brevibacillus sp. SIMBA_040]|uniref:hypothetical protein n=1 Tax=unclassified Brevibacillus TaxID=2684853 RepID=UPI00397C5F71